MAEKLNMRIVVHTNPVRTFPPVTGVGRFINNMTLGLAQAPGFDVQLLLSRAFVQSDGKLDTRSPLSGLEPRAYALPERLMERTWKLTGRPFADRWCADADWVFVPSEARVPTRSIPTALTVHDVRCSDPMFPHRSQSDFHRVRRRTELWLRPALARSRKILTVSEFSKSRLMELFGIDEQKIAIVGCGVEQSFFDIAAADRAAVRRPCDRPYLLSVGGLHPAKDPDSMFAVAARLAERKSDIMVVSVGQREAEAARRAQAFPNLMVMGKVSDEELPQYVRGAVAVLMLSHYEGFGIPAIEAMAAGTPAIAAARTAMPEVMADAGLLADLTRPDAADQIADWAERLLSDEAFRAEHVRRGRLRAAQFTWAACVERLINVLQFPDQK